MNEKIGITLVYVDFFRNFAAEYGEVPKMGQKGMMKRCKGNYSK